MILARKNCENDLYLQSFNPVGANSVCDSFILIAVGAPLCGCPLFLGGHTGPPLQILQSQLSHNPERARCPSIWENTKLRRSPLSPVGANSVCDSLLIAVRRLLLQKADTFISLSGDSSYKRQKDFFRG